MTIPTAEHALAVASIAHGSINQRRKYTNEPYITHPIAVADIIRAAGGTENMIAAAYLHDVVEDTPTTLTEIELRFNLEITRLVDWLTEKPIKGNRATRKNAYAEQLAQAPSEAQTIKVADMIHNTISIKQHDPRFWKTYREEKLHMLKLLTRANKHLLERAFAQIT